MRRLRLLFVLVGLGLLAPIAFLVQRALHSAELERRLRHQTVAERVFDEMERGLSRVLEREEQRPFDQYVASADPTPWPFVIGYFQIDPDGRLRTLPAGRARTNAELERAVSTYWRADRDVAGWRAPAPAQVPGTTIDLEARAPAAAEPKPEDQRMAKQAVSAFDALRSLNRAAGERVERQKKGAEEYAASSDEVDRGAGALADSARPAAGPLPSPPPWPDMATGEGAEPMTGRVIDAGQLMLYRTVLRDTRGYRQGVLLDVGALGGWLREQGLGTDGLAAYATVAFEPPAGAPAAGADDGSAFVYQHRFAEPFDDLSARLMLRALPSAGSGAYVPLLGALLLASGVLGLAALYRMVAVAVGFAERRSNFVAAVSHELKTPLTAIRMYGEMLRDGMVPSDAKRHEYYRHITVESERLSRLINNVLEYSRLEKDSRPVTLTSASVAPVVREVADLLRPHVEGEGFELSVELEAGLPPVRFERDALMQVLWNLADNAVKYARDGSPKRIELRGWQEGGRVHVAVRDYGPGVAARHLGRIFEPFYRGENELTRRSKGTGLGLALVRGLVERMGARVGGRNVPDGGFAVEIVFAVAETA